MADKTGIEWADSTWTPIRARNLTTGKVGWHCEHVSEACRFCYAEVFNRRLGTGLDFKPGHLKDVEIFLDERMLTQPLRWRRPRRIFVCSMTDLFADFVSDEMIDRVFAVMALVPQHTFQVLTKRADRMRDYVTDPETPGRVARSADAMAVAAEIAAMGVERIVPIDGFPGYFVSDHGHIYSGQGSDACLRCGAPMPEGIARRKFCGKKCRQMDAYDRSMGRTRSPVDARRRMMPMPGDQGHSRVMLYRGSDTVRELVHRLVLTAFDRPAAEGEQGCHRNGDPTVNALPNLRWGTQSSNWSDRRRHGKGGPSDMPWPLPNVWKGVSVEDQVRADERIPPLLQTPAAVRFLSCEPLLGALDLREYLIGQEEPGLVGNCIGWTPPLDLVIAGGESGRGARPTRRALFQALRDQCQAASVAYFHKQNGEFVDADEHIGALREFVRRPDGSPLPDGPLNFTDAAGIAASIGRPWEHQSDGSTLIRVGKKAAGRLLDGRTWDEMPR